MVDEATRLLRKNSTRFLGSEFYSGLAGVTGALGLIACCVMFVTLATAVDEVTGWMYAINGGLFLLTISSVAFVMVATGRDGDINRALFQRYHSSAWTTFDGKSGVAYDFSDFGRFVSLAFPDGSNYGLHVDLCRPNDNSEVPGMTDHLGYLPAMTAQQIIEDRYKAFRHRLYAISGAIAFVAAALLFTICTGLIAPQAHALVAVSAFFLMLIGFFGVIRAQISNDELWSFQRRMRVKDLVAYQWRSPDGQIGKFVCLNHDENIVTLEMADGKHHRFAQDFLVRI